MTDRLSDSDLIGKIIALDDGRKFEFKGKMNVTCYGTGFNVRAPGVRMEIAVKEKKADAYFVIGDVGYGSKYGPLGNIGGHTTYSIPYGDYIESDENSK